MQFQDLPSDVVLLIADAIENVRDIFSFTRTCKYLHKLLINTLHLRDIKNNNSAIIWAAKKGRTQLGLQLVQLGAAKDDYYTNKSNPHPIHVAANFDRAEFVSMLLANGVDVNHKNLFNITALQIVTTFGHTSVMEILLGEKGISVNAADMCVSSPLYAALLTERPEAVKVLLRHADVDVNHVRRGLTPLEFAVLQKQEGSIDALLADSRTLLRGANSFYMAIDHHDVDLLKRLLGMPQSSNKMGSSLSLLYQEAINADNVAAVSCLLEMQGCVVEPILPDLATFHPHHLLLLSVLLRSAEVRVSA